MFHQLIFIQYKQLTSKINELIELMNMLVVTLRDCWYNI